MSRIKYPYFLILKIIGKKECCSPKLMNLHTSVENTQKHISTLYEAVIRSIRFDKLEKFMIYYLRILHFLNKLMDEFFQRIVTGIPADDIVELDDYVKRNFIASPRNY